MKDDALFGVHAVGEWLRSDPGRIERLLVAPNPNDRVRKLISLARAEAIPVEEIAPAALQRLAGKRNPKGVAARVHPFPYADLDTALEGVEAPLVLVVDGVTDPGNLGALLRSAAFFGACAVVLPMDRSAPISPVVERSAAGAAARIAICRVGSLIRTVEALQERGVRVVASIVGGHPAPWEHDLTGPLALMVGSEDRGLRPSLRRAADLKTSLETAGPESLNVAAFTGVLLYETARQRKGFS